MQNTAPRFTYFMARPGPSPPRWIRPAQWALLAAWFLFARWLVVGDGFDLLYMSYSNFHGIFTDERIWGDAILPNLGLVSLPILALELWLQVLWQRCRVAVTGPPGAWFWEGRRGPASPERMARTPGGAWLKGDGRWWYIAHGFTDGEGLSLLAASGARAVPWWHPARFASPLALLLLMLGGGAWVMQRPVAENRAVRNQVSRALWAGREADAEALVRDHPEFRPWVRYVQSQRGCDTAQCLHGQIITRLEGLSIGPLYANEDVTLLRLLILNGWSTLAMRIMEPGRPEAFEIPARLGLPLEARMAPPPRPGKGREQTALVLLAEGRLEEAMALTERDLTDQDTQRAVAFRAVLCYLGGRCAEADRLARLLMAPQALRQARLTGDAPASALGSLQRAAREVMVHASYAVGLALLGHMEGASSSWNTAQALATKAGLTGLLDVDRVLLRRVAPDGPWSTPLPPHRPPGPRS